MRKFARLIVLGVAIAAGGSAAWLANGLQPAEQAQTLQVKPQVVMVDVMVAAKDLPAGSKISDTECDWQAWPEDAVVKGMVRKSEELAQNDPVKGSISRVAMFRGEPIRREKLVKGDGTGFLSALLPAGRRAIAINIDAQGGTTAGGLARSA
jgi:pilus assembly protein CpaB